MLWLQLVCAEVNYLRHSFVLSHRCHYNCVHILLSPCVICPSSNLFCGGQSGQTSFVRATIEAELFTEIHYYLLKEREVCYCRQLASSILPSQYTAVDKSPIENEHKRDSHKNTDEESFALE